MSDFIASVQEYFDGDTVRAIVHALIIVIVGFGLARLVSRRLRTPMLQAQQNLILKRALSAVLIVVSLAWSLSTLGLDLKVVLGAAGILTVALGFAAQTSVSNLISGAFLMGERPFGVGDVIRVDDITGEVLSIDSMSIKLRTFDNLLVRIPNETMLKANLINLSYFPIRRYDMLIGVAYDTDMAKVRTVLMDVARRNPLCLNEPAPLFLFLAFGESALELQFSIWSKREAFLDMRTSMHEQIKKAFEEHGIEIPYPQRVVHLRETRQTAAPENG